MSATLKGSVRQKVGSRHARALRAGGKIPACIQGEGKPHANIAIDEHEFLAARRHHEHLFDIEVEGGAGEVALVQELQWDPFGETIVHVEFRRVVRGQKTEVEVGLEFVGHPKGGVLNHLVTHVTVLALPSQIPDSIEVKVDEMEPGDPIVAKDLRLPEGVELAMEPDTQVAVVVTVREEVEPSGEGEEEGTGEEPSAEPSAPPSEE